MCFGLLLSSITSIWKPPRERIDNASMSEETNPGQGWSNGDIAPQLFPVTQDGRVQLYSGQRRWIGLQAGWTRIGAGASEMDARHSSSQAAGKALVADGGAQEAQAVRALISQLCERFYQMGWATGTGGGVSIRVGGVGRPWRVFVAPSGIQKEDMIGDDVYELVSLSELAM
jgi:hypothetical protein